MKNAKISKVIKIFCTYRTITVHCALDMINIDKKILEINFFLPNKVIEILWLISYSTALAICQYCSVLKRYYKIYLKIAINFLSKKNIFLDPFLCNFVRSNLFISYLSILTMSSAHIFAILGSN